MRISIAMCTYNGSRFLPDQIASLIGQTRPPDEVVICDDSSTDSTVGLLENFAASAPFKVRLHCNAVNLGSTRNFDQAIRLCQGDVIALCDQDDIWHPDKLKRAEQVLMGDSDVGLIFSDGEIIDANNTPLGYTLWQSLKFDRELQQQIKTGAAFEMLYGCNIVTGATMAFRSIFKELILPIPHDTSCIHDAWIAQMISATARLAPIDERLISYRRHERQQIGVTPPGAVDGQNSAGLLAVARRKSALLPEINRIKAIRDRLNEQRRNFKLKVNPRLEMRIRHLETRASISGRRIVNVPYVLREVLTLRYHRYSNGFYSALKDLLS